MNISGKWSRFRHSKKLFLSLSPTTLEANPTIQLIPSIKQFWALYFNCRKIIWVKITLSAVQRKTGIQVILYYLHQKVSKYDQEIPQSHATDQPMAAWERDIAQTVLTLFSHPFIHQFIGHSMRSDLFTLHINFKKWVWSGKTTITNCRPIHGTVRKSYRIFYSNKTSKRHKSKASKRPTKLSDAQPLVEREKTIRVSSGCDFEELKRLRNNLCSV